MDFLQQILATFVFGYILLSSIKSYWKRRNLPPGPYGLPLVGYAPFIPTEYQSLFNEFTKKYGRIFSLTLYGTDVVVVSDFDVIKKILMKDVFNGRPDKWFFSLFGSLLISWNGEEWKEQRKFALRIFKQLGLGKEVIEDLIHKENDYLLEQVMKKQAENLKDGYPINTLLGPSSSNVISLLVLGDRYDFDHPTRIQMDNTVIPKPEQQRGSYFGITGYLISMVLLLMKIPFGIFRQFRENIDWIKKYMASRQKYYQQNFDPDNDDVVNFIQAYQKEMKDPSLDKKYFDDEHLYSSALTFFLAGSVSSKDFLEWSLSALVVHPEVQEKMRQEIDSVVGRDRRISMHDKQFLPYCEAVITEIERFSSITPIGIPHAVLEDTDLENYFLPKGTQVIIDALNVHFNPEYFEEPTLFKPERFLSPNGKFVRNEKVIAFGYGKRSCPGEPLARTEIFLYLTTFVQKYVITSTPGSLPSLEGKLLPLSRVPKIPLKCVFHPRD